MRGDIHPAAFRLLQQLPVRTHRAPPPPDRAEPHRRRKGMGSGGSNKQGIKYRGREFASLRDAKKTLKCSTKTLHSWVKLGIAEFI